MGRDELAAGGSGGPARAAGGGGGRAGGGGSPAAGDSDGGGPARATGGGGGRDDGGGRPAAGGGGGWAGGGGEPATWGGGPTAGEGRQVAGGGGPAAGGGGGRAGGGGEPAAWGGGPTAGEGRQVAGGGGPAAGGGGGRAGGGGEPAAGGSGPTAGEGRPVAGSGGGRSDGGGGPAAGGSGGPATGGGEPAAGGGAGGFAPGLGEALAWTRWLGSTTLPHRPRGLPPDLVSGHAAQLGLATLRMALDTEAVYDSVDALARALSLQQTSYSPWQRRDPAFKPLVSGLLWTPSGPRKVTILLDTGATHCFIGTELVTTLGLPPGSGPGPAAVSMASPDMIRTLPPPVAVHLALGTGTPLCEIIDMSPLALGPGLDIILGWDWISSHDLRFLYPQGAVRGSGLFDALTAPLQATGSALAQTLIGHGEFRRMLRRVVPADPPASAATTPTATPSPPPLTPHSGLSKPLEPLGAAEVARLDAAAEARRARWVCRRCGPTPPPVRFATGVELLSDGTELHLASVRFVDTSLDLQGSDHPAFAALKAEYADVLGGPPPGLPPDRGIELVLDTGDRPMPRTRPVKRLSEGELAELRRQLLDLLDRGWIQPSTAGHAASVLFARKAHGSWRICYDYRGLNAITEHLVEPLPHIDVILDETKGARWFTKFDLAQSYHQVRISPRVTIRSGS